LITRGERLLLSRLLMLVAGEALTLIAMSSPAGKKILSFSSPGHIYKSQYPLPQCDLSLDVKARALECKKILVTNTLNELREMSSGLKEDEWMFEHDGEKRAVLSICKGV